MASVAFYAAQDRCVCFDFISLPQVFLCLNSSPFFKKTITLTAWVFSDIGLQIVATSYLAPFCSGANTVDQHIAAPTEGAH